MNEEPCEADGDEHGDEDESEHEAPRGTIVGWRGCPGMHIFFLIGHRLVYGDCNPEGVERPRGYKNSGAGRRIAATQIRENGV
jgi:hypothetical protein